MPRNIQVSGAYDYKPTKEQVQRLHTFLQWLPTKNAPTEVVIVPPEKMGEVSKLFSKVPTNVSLTVGNRSYVNAKLFDAKDDFVRNELPEAQFSKGNALEWALAHEAAHLSSSLSPVLQEQQDGIFNDDANNTMRDWNGKKAQAYQALQNQIVASQGQFQPTSAPIETNLTAPPLPTHVQKTVDQVRSQEAAHQAWLQSQSQTPSKYQMGQPQ